jgi:oligopeptide/dipeptide ABC transporter ATP-binding protein
MINAVEVKNLKVSFPTPAGYSAVVRGINLTIKAGERVAIVGESGSGKTMLGLSMLGIQPTSAKVEGEVLINGVDMVSAPDSVARKLRGKDISMVFQEPLTSLNPVRTVASQLSESVTRHTNLNKKDAAAKVLEVLTAVGIPSPAERLKAYPHQLSGGLRQRVMIALALINNPQLVVADEPTTALDATIQAQILDLLRSGMGDASLMLITHDLAVAADVCNRIVVMYAGNIVEQGPVAEILSTPKHPYTRGLLAAIPRFDPARPALNPIPGSPPQITEIVSGCRFASRCNYADDVCRAAEPAFENNVACYHPVIGATR